MPLSDVAALPSSKTGPPDKTLPLQLPTCTKEISWLFSDNNSSSRMRRALLILKVLAAPQLVRTMCVLLETKIIALWPKSSSTHECFAAIWQTWSAQIDRTASRSMASRCSGKKSSKEQLYLFSLHAACISTLNMATWWRRFRFKVKRVTWTTHFNHAQNIFTERGSAAERSS